MNKKVFIGFLILISIFSVFLIYNLFEKNNHKNNEIEYKIIKNGYSSYESQIISSYEQYLTFANYIDSQNKSYGKVYDFNTNEYNKKYFATKSIAILNIITGTGMNKLRNIDISINNNVLICDVDIEYTNSQVVTADINGKVILVEIDKSIEEFKINK